MGFRDDVRKLNSDRAEGAQKAADALASGGCSGEHYVTEVNKGSIHMGTWKAHLNERYTSGYRLQQVFEQDGNTVTVFEHHWH
jgi:hypothetical protein